MIRTSSLQKFLKLSHNIRSEYVTILKDKLTSIGNGYAVILEESFPNINNVVVLRSHLEILPVIFDGTITDNSIEINNDQIIFKSDKSVTYITIVDSNNEIYDLNFGDHIVTIDDEDMFNKLHKFMKKFKFSEITTENNKIKATADQTLDLVYDVNVDNLPDNLPLSLILFVPNIKTLSIYTDAIVATLDDNVKITLLTNIVDKEASKEIVIESLEEEDKEDMFVL